MPNPNIIAIFIARHHFQFYDMDEKKLIVEIKKDSIDKIISEFKKYIPIIDENDIKNKINYEYEFYKNFLDI
jgi:hypothetical protein